MTSQLVIFRAFLFIFFRPPPPDPSRSEKKSRKSTNKKNLALAVIKRCSNNQERPGHTSLDFKIFHSVTLSKKPTTTTQTVIRICSAGFTLVGTK